MSRRSHALHFQDARRALGSSRRNAAHPSFESLDAFFCDCLERVQAAYNTLDKACKIRVECWIVKLNGPYPLPNVAWRKNRNAFAALLARAVEEIDFREPFDRRPPEGSLPTLAPHLRARIPDRSHCRRTARDFWEQQRAWLETNRGRSGRNFADEAAEASRTFHPRRTPGAVAATSDNFGFSPALRDGGTVDGGGGGGGGDGGVWGKGYCGVCGAENSTNNNTVPPSPPSRYASPRARDNHNNNNSSPSLTATRAAYKAWVNRSSQGSPLGKVGGARPESARSEQRGGGGGGGGSGQGGQCGCNAGETLRALQTMVREQALQIGALRVQQAYRRRVQVAELKRIRHEHMRHTEGVARLTLRQDEARSRLTSVRLEELLAERVATTTAGGGGRDEGGAAAAAGGGGGGGGEEGGTALPTSSHPKSPLPGYSKCHDGDDGAADQDLERRLDRFQEDARVLVHVARKNSSSSSSSGIRLVG